MPQSWDSVQSNPAYQALPQDQKNAAREQYFNDVVAPQVPKDHIDIARQQFDSYSAPKVAAEPSYSERSQEIANKGFGEIGSSFKSLMSGHVGDTEYSPVEDLMGMAGGATNAFLAPVTAAVAGGSRPLEKVIGGPEAQKQMAAGDYSQADKLAQDMTNLVASALPFLPKGEPVDIYARPPIVPKTAPLELSRENVKKASKNAYKIMDNSGTGLSPNWTDRAIGTIESYKEKPFFEGTVLTSDQKAINDALDEYLPAKGKQANMRDIQALDSTLGDKVAKAYVSGDYNKGRILSEVQDKIHDSLIPEKLAPEDLVGDREGIDALTQHAIPLWAAQSKMADIEKIIKRANAMTNPATSMQTGFRNLMLNEGKFKQYPPDVQKMIEKAATTGNVDDALMIVGSRLNPIIGGAAGLFSGGADGGMAGAAITYGTSKAGRWARNNFANRRADKIMNTLIEPLRPSVEKYHNIDNPKFSLLGDQQKLLEAPQEMLALPAPDYMQTTPEGVTSKMTPEETARTANLQDDPYAQAARGARADMPSQGILDAASLRQRAVPEDIWNKLNVKQKTEINSQIEQMWQQKRMMPISKMIDIARRNAQYMAAAKGEAYKPTAVGEAFKKSGYAKGGPVRKNLTAEFLAARKRA